MLVHLHVTSRRFIAGCALAVATSQPAAAASLVVTNATDLVNGNTSSPAALIASPGADGISLREALLAANNAVGPHTVTFSPALAGQTIVLAAPLPAITRDQITLIGLTAGGAAAKLSQAMPLRQTPAPGTTGSTSRASASAAQSSKPTAPRSPAGAQPNVTIDGRSAVGFSPALFVAASSFGMSALRFLVSPQFSAVQIGGATYNSMGQLVNAPQLIRDIQITDSGFTAAGNIGNSFAVHVTHSVGVTSNATISNVLIANNSFDQLFESVNLQGSGANNLIEDVVIFNNTFSQNTVLGTSALEVANHDGINNTIRRTRIVQNTFTGNTIGIDINNNRDAGSPPGTDTTTTGNVIDDTLIEGNVFTGNLEAIGMAAGTGQPGFLPVGNTISNTRIFNNLIRRTGFGGNPDAAGIHVFDNQFGASGNTVNGLLIVNNTIHGGGPPGGAVWVETTGGVLNVQIINTTFWAGNALGDITGVPATQVSKSIINQTGYTGVNGNTANDPLFVNAAGGDFHLQAASPARGAGTSAGAPSIDLDCQLRNAPPSIGAYEFNGPNICPQQVSMPFRCAQDVMVCPSGSLAQRIAPRCEFAACPAQAPTASSFQLPRSTGEADIGRVVGGPAR